MLFQPRPKWFFFFPVRVDDISFRVGTLFLWLIKLSGFSVDIPPALNLVAFKPSRARSNIFSFESPLSP